MQRQKIPSPRHIAAIATCLLADHIALAQAPAAQEQPSSALATVSPEVADEASSYSLGLVFGNQLRGSGLYGGVSIEAVTRGLRDGLAGKALDPADRNQAMQLMHKARDEAADRNRAAARDFLAKNAKAAGVVTTATGLQYQVFDAGDTKAASPASSNRVTIHYRGRLLDGTEFDNSDAHAQAAVFTVGSVLKGWNEALLLMKPGAKWRLFVPPDLAYGNYPPPIIPPGALLVFDIELLNVESASSLALPHRADASLVKRSSPQPATTTTAPARRATNP